MDQLVFFIHACILTVALSVPLNKDNSSIALEFMRKYGYLGPEGLESDSLYSVEEAVKDVQKFGGIPQTGLIDTETLQLMQSSRCGVADIIKHRSKRYALGSNLGWNKRNLSYFIANWSPKIGEIPMKDELKKAFEAWSMYGRLKFQEVYDPNADIVIGFSRGAHGDGYPFDGPGSILAHAFFPGEMGSYAGDVHFDDDEEWKINPGEFQDGIDFFTVAVHELGHSLGLAHSAMPDSIMNPYYRKTAAFSLGYDDILGMYELYINRLLTGDTADESTSVKPTSTSQPTTRKYNITFEGDDESVEDHKNHDKKHRIPGHVPPFIPETRTSSADVVVPPDGCNGNFDAVAYLREELFVFKNEWLWRLSEPGKVLPQYPVQIHRMFHKLPARVNRIDAVYQRETDSSIVFFIGDKYWVFDGNDFIENSPQLITDFGLPDYLNHIDAVMVWDKNKKTYLFSGNEYWRYNETTHTMDPGYPQSIDIFSGVPHHLDSAFTWRDGITYFFKDKNYWAFNNTWRIVEDGYPRSATKYLLNCSLNLFV